MMGEEDAMKGTQNAILGSEAARSCSPTSSTTPPTKACVTIAAALTAHALNVGYVPVISAGVPALTRGRISHVDQNYLRPANYTAANSILIAAQDSIELARRWGGGLVAGIDGMRFGPQHPRAPEPQVLRSSARRDLAEHAQRPSGRALGSCAVGHPARLAAHDRPDLQPGRRASAPT
jgi:hypothetical protein